MQFTHLIRVSVVTAGLVGALGAGSAYAFDSTGAAVPSVPSVNPASTLAAVPQLPTVPSTLPLSTDPAGMLPTIPGLPAGDPTQAVTSVVHRVDAAGQTARSELTGLGVAMPDAANALHTVLSGTSVPALPGRATAGKAVRTAVRTARQATSSANLPNLDVSTVPGVDVPTLPGLDGLVAGLPTATRSNH